MSDETPRQRYMRHMREFADFCEEAEQSDREDAARVMEAAVCLALLVTFTAVAWCLSS